MKIGRERVHGNFQIIPNITVRYDLVGVRWVEQRSETQHFNPWDVQVGGFHVDLAECQKTDLALIPYGTFEQDLRIPLACGGIKGGSSLKSPQNQG